MNYSTKVSVLVILVFFAFNIKGDASSDDSIKELSDSNMFPDPTTLIVSGTAGAVLVPALAKCIDGNPTGQHALWGVVLGLLLGGYYDLMNNLSKELSGDSKRD